jgi:uncharacterized protein YjbI with pentapeptide repeats
MANPEHVEILKQGVEIWNKWRRENPDIIPDLKKADLQRIDLNGANLSEANLKNAKLNSANLTGADIHWADLSKTNLSKANLSRVDLNWANLTLADLSEADLSWANLNGANLSETNLRRAKLIWVNFSEANLRKAELSEANLNGANFSWAHLIKSCLSKTTLSLADFTLADLSDADLSLANLSGTKLIRSNLHGTIFKRILLSGTVFCEVDLSKSIGLENVYHHGRSTVGIDTIYASKGKIPKVFLQGCGVPEDFIQFMSSLTGKAFEYYSCFISYSSKDQDFAERLHADLQNKGVRCWFAPEDMKIGDKIRDKIDQSIRIHDKLLLVLSEHSINSEWVEDEVEAAYEQERQRGKTVLFPIRLDPAVMDTGKAWAAKLRRSRHIGDFTQWKDHDVYKKALDRLMRDLRAEEPAGSD